MLRAEGRLLIQNENSEPFNPLRLSSGEKAVLYYIAGVLFAMPNAVILVEDPEFYLIRLRACARIVLLFI